MQAKNLTGLSLFSVLSLSLAILSLASLVKAQESTTTVNSIPQTSIIPSVNTDSTWYKKEAITGNNIQVGDFVVGPGKIEVTVKPGETVTKYMTITNRISDGRSFGVAVEDMSGSADPTQSVVLLGDARGPYTLKDDVFFHDNKVDLNLGERAVVPITITMPQNAQPGGYYGAVLVSTLETRPKNQEVTTDIQSPIISRVGVLLFITVSGKVDTSGSLTKFSTIGDKWWFQSGPVNLGLLFENTGSVYLNPYGEVKVQNIFGEEVGLVEVDPWFVLPKSLRLREVTWDRQLLLGRYTFTAKINRGYGDIVDEKVFHIWVLPWKIVGGLFIIIFLIIFLIRFMFTHFEFKRKG